MPCSPRPRTGSRSACAVRSCCRGSPWSIPDSPPACRPRSPPAPGLDALTQLIEPFVSCRANPLTDGLCAEGLRRAGRSLRLAFHDGATPRRARTWRWPACWAASPSPTPAWGRCTASPRPSAACFPRRTAPCAPRCCPTSWRSTCTRPGRDSPAGKRCGVTPRSRASAAPEMPPPPPRMACAGCARWSTNCRSPDCALTASRPEHVALLVEQAAQASSMKANPLPLTRDELVRNPHPVALALLRFRRATLKSRPPSGAWRPWAGSRAGSSPRWDSSRNNAGGIPRPDRIPSTARFQ